MTALNIAMHGLHDYPNDYKVRLLKMLNCIGKADGILDRNSLPHNFEILDDFIGTRAYH